MPVTADIYNFGEIDQCQVSGCECLMRPWSTRIKAKDGNLVLYLCPCHVLMALDAVATISVNDEDDEDERRAGNVRGFCATPPVAEP